MKRIEWSDAEKEREWAFAKEKLIVDGKLLPEGTKLRRKNYPDILNHSFMIIAGRMIAFAGKDNYLGHGFYADTKLCEEEDGNPIALKITKLSKYRGYKAYCDEGDPARTALEESTIAHDLGIADRCVTRIPENGSRKHYIAYQYFGISLLDYLRERAGLSLDERYALSIKISLALHDLHTGRNAKSKQCYQHDDIHNENLLIDDQGEPHFIDYGLARALKNISYDIRQLLCLFFLPRSERDERMRRNKQLEWVFGNWVGTYAVLFRSPWSYEEEYFLEKQTIHVYVKSADKSANGTYAQIHYALYDLRGNLRKGMLQLSELGINNVKPKRGSLRWTDFKAESVALIEKKVLELAHSKGYIINQADNNRKLYNLLKDPGTDFRYKKKRTALDVAETLTLCRLQLDSFRREFKRRPESERLAIIQLLNAASAEIVALYAQFSVLDDQSCLDEFKQYMVFHLTGREITTNTPQSNAVESNNTDESAKEDIVKQARKNFCRLTTSAGFFARKDEVSCEIDLSCLASNALSAS